MSGKVRIALSDRFMSKVNRLDDGCWKWTARIAKNGYGVFGISTGKLAYAHRVSYEMHKGKIPKKMLVCHTCDNRWCVNPDHLWVGTHADNMADCSLKGRARGPNFRGEKIGTAKLTADKVLVIRARLLKGETKVSIARDFEVSKTAINHIEIGKTWRHV